MATADAETKKWAQEPTGKHKAFAKRLIAGMLKSGVEPSTIIKVCEVDPETVRLWLRGKRMPRDEKLRRLAKMIGVDESVLRYGSKKGTSVMPQLRGEHITDDDELRLLHAYRGLSEEWAREALRRRAVELLEEFGKKGVKNPWAQAGTQ